MTWSHWQVPPFTTSVFFVLGVLTFYWVSYNWLISWTHAHQFNVSDETIRTWYGLIYMIVFVFGIQSLIVGQSYAWEFMNFELIAITFCAYFLNVRISYLLLFPIILVYMVFDGSLGYWQSWAHAITLFIFFVALNVAHTRFQGTRHAVIPYLAIILPFGGLLWFWMKLKFGFSWGTLGEEWLYLMIFETLLYIYVSMLSHDAALKIQLAKFASHDALTQTGNFAAYTEDIERLFRRSSQRGQALSMMMFDIDHFKAINDTYGHSIGDNVLREVAATVQTVLAANDPHVKFYRTGGEEFNLLFPGYDVDATKTIVDQIFTAINHLEVPAGDDVVRLSVSVGVSAITTDDKAPMDFYNRVDRNLYHSKRHGRMQITVA